MSCAWAIDWARTAVGALLVARADSGAFLHFRLALAHASRLVKSAIFHAIVGLISAQVAADLFVFTMFFDAVWWRGWSGAVLVSDLIVAWAAVGAISMAGTVVRARVKVLAVTGVLTNAGSVATDDAIISDGNTIVNAFLGFVSPNKEALFDDGRILGIAAPSWAGAAVGAFLVAGAGIHAGVLVGSADRQARRFSIASEGAVVRGISATISALLPEVIVVRIFKAVAVGLWHALRTVAIAEVVPLWARAAD